LSLSFTYSCQNPVFWFSRGHATCPNHLLLLVLITLMIFGEKYTQLTSSLRNFLLTPAPAGSQNSSVGKVTRLGARKIHQCITWKCSIPNLTRTSKKIWEVEVNIHLRPYVKYDCHWADFHETYARATTFYKELLYQISWKSDEPFTHW
jgi:hypothetical protein